VSYSNNLGTKVFNKNQTTGTSGNSLFQNLSHNRLSSMEERVLYNLRNVSIHFKDVNALSSVNLVIEKGDFTFITGPSGAGKTTLLNLLSGDILPTSGSFSYPLIKKKSLFISRVFQNLQVIEDWTVQQNIDLCYAKEIFKSRKEFKREVLDLVNLFEMKNHLTKKVKNLNGGAKQKTAIIRALLARPDVFLADEPTSSLDRENAKRLYEVLKFYNQKMGMTVLWATHQLELINQFHGKLIHLSQGRVVRSQ
jgi:cell division transport system ATP-binding protein